MRTRTDLSVLNESALVSPLNVYVLTKHMMTTWHRYDMRRRFHLNSDASRLKFIVWYTMDHLRGKEYAFDPISSSLRRQLIKPALAWGPLSTFMFAYWREYAFNDHSKNIQTEEGYINFVVDFLMTIADLHPTLKTLIPTGAIIEVQKPFYFDGTHHLSKACAAIWKQSSIYQSKYQNLSDWRNIEAFNFDIIVHAVAERGCIEIIAPETVRYWSAPLFRQEPGLSRLQFALAAMSPRFQNSGPDLEVMKHVNMIVDWFVNSVLISCPALIHFSGSVAAASSKNGIGTSDQQSARLPLPGESSDEIDVLIIGPLSAASGLGTGARRSMEALEAAKVSYRALDLLFDNPAASLEAIPEKVRYSGETPKVTLWHFNAEYLPDVIATYPQFINPRKNIAYFFWETEAMPAAHALACEIVDEIWAPSQFVRDCYARHADIEVINVGTAVNIPKLNAPYPRSHFKIGDEFAFMFSFDAYSVTHRKNPAAVVKAFRTAFPEGSEPVSLIIKTQNLSNAHWGNLFGRNEELFELCDADSRVRIIDKTFSLRELYSLKSAIDCYVSLHRSEGFGYGPAEAMALGKPVIMTNYSANTEFGNADNSLLVRNTLIRVLDAEYLYWTSDMVWADVDIVHAAQCMRQVFDNQADAIEMGQRGKHTILTDFSVGAMAAKYRHRLRELIDNR